MDNRPHCEFIQAQMLPWRRIGPLAARPDAEYKFLSRDAATGACSALIRYPAGYHRIGPECIDADEEIYVLEGEVNINGVEYGFDSFAFLPAHFERSEMFCKNGAVVLSFFSKEPLLNKDFAKFDSSRLIKKIDVLHMPWDMTLNDPNLSHLGISRKNLRLDDVTGERTFLSMILPHSEPPQSKGPTETHPIVEEAYLISGSLTGPNGTMSPGAYFWRPPNIPHGPFGTRWGCVLLVRFVGGKHINVWSKSEREFSFAAPYNPNLPPELEYLREMRHPPPSRY